MPTAQFNAAYVSDVNNRLFESISAKDDLYFGLVLDDGAAGFILGLASAVVVTYDGSAQVTDLAGNLLPPTVSPLLALERTPPRIRLALAIVGQQKMYASFSEPVYHERGSGRSEIQAGDFEVVVDASLGSYTINSLEVLSRADDDLGATEVFLHFDTPLSADAATTGLIRPLQDPAGGGSGESIVYDREGNSMPVSSVHRLTDLGLGIVEPVWASDGIRSHDDPGRPPLRNFEGAGRLLDRDITLEVTINANQTNAASGARLIYDVSPGAQYIADDLWLPQSIPGLVPASNPEARVLLPFRNSGAIRDFLIPSADPEIENGSVIEFVLQLGELYVARVTDIDDPRKAAPWLISIEDIVRQRAGVTVLRNVINPLRNESALINYTLGRSGVVSVLVFDLAGDLVDVLHRGRQSRGEYSLAWDGKNRGDRVVARGVYFIQVTGPEINETRKVLVVK